MSTTSQPQAEVEEEEEEREWTTFSPIPKTPAPEHVARLAANLSPASSTVEVDMGGGGDIDIDDGGGFLIPANEQGHEAEFLREAMPEHHGYGHAHDRDIHEGGAMTCPPKPSLSYAVPSTSNPPPSSSHGRAGRGLFSMSIGSAGLPTLDEMDIDTSGTNNNSSSNSLTSIITNNNNSSGEGSSSSSQSVLPGLVGASSTMAGTMGLLRDNRERNLGVMMRLNAARRKSLQFAPKVGSPLARSWTGGNGGNNGPGGAGGAGGAGGGGGMGGGAAGMGGGGMGGGTAQ